MEPVYYGHHFKTIVRPQGYYSGGKTLYMPIKYLTNTLVSFCNGLIICLNEVLKLFWVGVTRANYQHQTLWWVGR